VELRKNGGVEIDYGAELYRGSSLLGIAELKIEWKRYVKIA
jgi:hypothetical protein